MKPQGSLSIGDHADRRTLGLAISSGALRIIVRFLILLIFRFRSPEPFVQPNVAVDVPVEESEFASVFHLKRHRLLEMSQ